MAKVFVAGHKGMVGSSIVRELAKTGAFEILKCDRSELDLRDQNAVRKFFETNSVDQVYLAAARVGGIYANSTYPAEFIYDNLMIQSNVIHSALLSGVERLIFLGSSCIYPREAGQPIDERELLGGYLEPTNRAYAIAKIAGLEMCRSYNSQYGTQYRSLMPTNLYGPGDNYHRDNSHVIPGMIVKLHEAKLKKLKHVVLWGSGSPLREFLHVDDLARAAVYAMDLDPDSWRKTDGSTIDHLNVGSGSEITISELAKVVKDVVGFTGDVSWNPAMPDGTPRKLLNSNLINKLGWKPAISLEAGLMSTYSDFCSDS